MDRVEKSPTDGYRCIPLPGLILTGKFRKRKSGINMSAAGQQAVIRKMRSSAYKPALECEIFDHPHDIDGFNWDT